MGTKALPLILTTCVCISVFIYTIAQVELQDIRDNWNTTRCRPLVILMAHMVPTEKNADRSAFASDNFNFCITQLIDSSIAGMMAPVLSIFNSQLDATAPIQDSMNTLRVSASSLVMGPITQLFDFMWKKLGFILYQIVRIYTKLHSTFDRVFGITLSALFAGISMFKGIENSINFIIKVCIIILIIIMALMIIMFFALFPVMPVIMTTISIIAATAYGASVSGMGFCDAGDENCRNDSFCVAPGTLVATWNGWKPVEELVCGEELEEGLVEGVLEVGVPNAKVVSIHGVTIAASHLVLADDGRWIPASESPDAVAYTGPPVTRLFCLNTSKHVWRVRSRSRSSRSIVLRDWEELPTEPFVDAAWEQAIYTLLNPVTAFTRATPSHPGRGLVGPTTFVQTREKGRVHIRDVRIGDHVLSSTESSSYTRVLGEYKDTSTRQPTSGPNSATWMLHGDDGRWIHPYHVETPDCPIGYQLITESGTFVINIYDAIPLVIRDFTEVGYNRIDETYAFVLSRLNGRNDEAHDVSC